MKIGLISDTHGILPETIFDIFKEVKHIYHAGDIGSPEVIQGLEIICPVHAVYGNIDTWPVTIYYPHILVHQVQEKKICVYHDIIKPKYFSYQLFKKNIDADIVISGHTHAAGFEKFRNVLYINPGSASKPRDRKLGTVAILNLDQEPLEPEIIEIK
jgi:putative phosphoesterase